MFLYALTLQRASAIVQSIHGNFDGTKQQQIVIARGKILDLVKLDPNTGKLYTLLSHEVFGVIRAIMAFRLTGGSKDYIVVGSDSGRIVILEYIPAKNVFEKVHQETFGKSGCRRIVPGQFLAVDPKGRAFMVGAVEKQKLVYILNRDAQARLTISSPLEAHKSSTFSFHTVGVDVGFENPMFACLEVDYEEADSDHTGEAAQTTPQLLTYYELDLGLNHVVRKYSEPLEEHGNFLIAVPGGSDGPSGVLVCSENYITYKNLGDQPDIRMPIPRRRNDLDDPERGMIFVCSATHKTKSMFFFLAQTEQGDLFKITLETDEDMVTEVRMKYFDTVPVAASMNVLKTGFLFIAAEFGNHYLYQIAHLGDDDDEQEFSSATHLEEGETFFFAPRPLRNLVEVDQLESLSPILNCRAICRSLGIEQEFSSAIHLEEGETFFFAPQPLRNLVEVDKLESLSPILNCRIADLANEDTPQLYVACGRGPKSSMRVLRHGLEVSEMAVSELPGNPNAVWTVKRNTEEEYDAYIIVSFVNATLVLSIGETVEEVTDSGFLGTTPTLSSSLIGDDALLQIYPDGIRHIRADKRVNEWKTPGKKNIVKCAVNQRQVVIALTGGELVYFEMDPTGQLNEYTERKEMSTDVKCMSLASVPSGEQRARFLAVGLDDNTVRIISLDQNDCLQPLSMQALPAPAESLCIVEMGSSSESREERGDDRGTSGGLFLNIGLQNGVLLRMVLDNVTGDLSDTRTRYLGSRPVKLFRIFMQGSEAVLAMSSRSWLSYWYQSRFHLTPLSYETLEYASGFASEQCPEGIVAISTNTLRILALEKLGAVFNQVSTPLKYSPRKFAILPDSSNVVVIETDHNAYTETTKAQRKQQMAEEMVEAAGDEDKELAAEMAEAFLKEDQSESEFGAPKAGSGMWASQIRLLNPVLGNTLETIKLEQNEAAFSLRVCKFNNHPDQSYLLIGTAKDLTLSPRSCSGGIIYTYLIKEEGKEIELLHKTLVDDVPAAICPFQGRVLIGVGKLLRIYDLGKKKLLRKCENKHIPNFIVNIDATGNRIIVSDVQESLHFIRYKRQENAMVIFADDTYPRWVTATCLLDHDTVMCADKFGNVSVIRLTSSVNDSVDEDPTGIKALWDRGVLSGASQKADPIATFHVGETVLSLQKCTLIPGGSESVVYTTLSGAIGILVPFTSHEDHDFFQHLEMHMRAEYPPLCGRDHISYRSYYFPVRNVIDGDLCEQFNSMDVGKQKSVAEELERNPSEVSKKLEDIRTRFAF